MAKRKVIFHYHIFKNAGTSFNHALREAFGDSFIEFDGECASDVITPSQIAETIQNTPAGRAFSSHQGMLPLPIMDDCEILGTLLLRHPLARIRSIYQFERKQQASSQGAIKAKEFSFGDYLRWRWAQSPAFFCFQAFYCARTESHKGYIPLETILERALRNLATLKCVGTVESYSRFLGKSQMLLEEMAVDRELPAFHANASEAASADRERIWSEILAGTDKGFCEMIEPLLKLDENLWEKFHNPADSPNPVPSWP